MGLAEPQAFRWGPPLGAAFPGFVRLRLADPFVVVGALGRRHLSPFQPPLKGYPSFSGNLLHRNLFG